MPIAKVTLKGISPYSQSRQHETEKLEKERPDDYEVRTWRNKMHVTDDGHVFIPPMTFKNCLDEAAKFLSVQIPGKGKATFTKHFEAGVLVVDGLTLPVLAKDVPAEWLNLDSNGQRGSGKRVKRCFPKILDWGGTVEFHVFDTVVTEPVFAHHIEEAGKFIGIGRFRPRNRGFYGRFIIEKIKWSK